MIDYLEKMMELAKEHYDIDIKKNFDSQRSGGSEKTDQRWVVVWMNYTVLLGLQSSLYTNPIIANVHLTQSFQRLQSVLMHLKKSTRVVA